jgi:inosine-uridine nucleoside N-ribohydrolase
MPTRIIMDVDTGTDDAVALMVAALSPDIELVGVTTVNGNVPVENATDNTLRTLDLIGARVPVFQGMAAPLARPNLTRGEDWSLTLDLPPARSRKQARHAVEWLIETLLASDGDIVLVPVGPFTNIATAMRMEPRILERIPELVIMGGSHTLGIMTPAAEFNVWVDPEAARVVLNCGRPVRMLPLDATHRALVATEDCARLRELGTPAATAAASFVEERIAQYDASQPMSRPGAAPVHDALAVCAIIDPSVVETKFINVDVETRGELTTGHTVCDLHKRSKREPNVHFAVDADEPKFVRMLMEILGRGPHAV